MQISALASPDLLQKLSRHLTAVGDDLDRGRLSAKLRANVAPALTSSELAAFDRLSERLHTIAAAAQDKVCVGAASGCRLREQQHCMKLSTVWGTADTACRHLKSQCTLPSYDGCCPCIHAIAHTGNAACVTSVHAEPLSCIRKVSARVWKQASMQE